MLKSLVQFFKSKPIISQTATTNPLPQQDIDGWLTPYTASELFNTELRQRYLALLWQQVLMA